MGPAEIMASVPLCLFSKKTHLNRGISATFPRIPFKEYPAACNLEVNTGKKLASLAVSSSAIQASFLHRLPAIAAERSFGILG